MLKNAYLLKNLNQKDATCIRIASFFLLNLKLIFIQRKI